MTGQRDDAPAARLTTARWKEVPGAGRPGYRAVCGRPRCPGSLGVLRWVTVGDPDATAAGWRGMRAGIERADAGLRAMQERADLPPGIDPVKRAAYLAERRAALAGLRGLADLAEREAVRVAARLAERGAAMRGWVLSPERPHHEPGTPAARVPRPMYHGHADTGYRISYGGKRSKDGRRIGRRPFVHGADPSSPPLLSAAESDPRHPAGRVVVPPCRVVCPVCGTRNEVGVPPEEASGSNGP